MNPQLRGWSRPVLIDSVKFLSLSKLAVGPDKEATASAATWAIHAENHYYQNRHRQVYHIQGEKNG